jgi:hypothetical protein
VDCQHRPRPAQVRHALAAPNQSDVDLPTNRQSSCGPTSIGPLEGGEHRSLSWHRD